MPVSIAQLAANEATVTISGGPLGDGNSIDVTYYPNKISTKALTQMGTLDGMAEALAEIIKSWDFLEPDGSLWAVTVDHLKELGVTILRYLADEISDHLRESSNPNQ